MISDTLFDAIAEIDVYLADPATAPAYAEPAVRAEVMRVRGEMERLREALDMPGSCPLPASPSPPYAALHALALRLRRPMIIARLGAYLTGHHAHTPSAIESARLAYAAARR